MGPLLGSICAWLLVLLLVGTSPFGMGVGVHRDQLLDPVLPHAHLRDGRIVAVSTASTGSQADQPVLADAARGPALGAGSAGLFGGIGADAPALPADVAWLLAGSASRSWTGLASDGARPTGLTFAPPDPPPTLSA